MKKTLTIIILSIISILLAMFIFLPKHNFSEIENRALSNIPKFSLEKIVDGTYTEEIETYINDHFPLRTFFMNIRTITHKLLGKQDINDVYLGKDSYLIEKYDEIDYQDKLIETINKFSNNNQDINISIMLVPTKISIYQNKLPNNITDIKQQETITNIYSKLNENINKIELSKALIRERDNYQLYYKTDHHWTTYGAYFGYKEYFIKNNLDYIDISDYNIKTITDSFKGSTYSKVVDPFSKSEKIDLFTYGDYDLDVEYTVSNKKTKTLYNYDYLDKKDKYAMFLDNNHPIVKITNNDLTTDKNILVIKDSYANSLIPFLTNHYKEIHVIDPRYYKKSITKYIKENEIKNVLILYNIGTLSTDKNILSIR